MNQTPEYYNDLKQEQREETFNNVTLIDYGQIF
jgi:hypothetical protein